ncbi:hypothetical protein VMCG_02895 [Cytospora schulzeri]|uniref:Clr5 domain-containing protein n=1 Tax=Cytospora schulzeri TaxID=448051 RepID=A0A423WZ42_9PEZI|nr:hypothetical protein VMCG_02895 [Valsa malicola]
MAGGRPRIEFEQHKDLIIQLYRDKTPWPRIEETLLTQYGCKVTARTIHHRFKEWDAEIIRVRTDVTDELKDQIKAYWADRATRPKTDEELHQKLLDDGFTVTLTAVARLRNELKLYRRWDHRFGRVRPQSELHRRRRHCKQKGSVFTDAQFAPPDDEDDEQDSVQPQPPGEPVRPPPQVTRSGGSTVLATRVPRQRRQPLPAQPGQPAQSTQIIHPPSQPHQQPFIPPEDPSSAMKDA